MKLIKHLKEDFRNYSKKNQEEERVFKAHYFSNYKGAFVWLTPFQYSFSCGIIGLSSRQRYSRILRHEYGHYMQLKKRGWIRYIHKIVIYSVTENMLYRKKKLPYDYYGSPWEAEADVLGGVEERSECTPWPRKVADSYIEMLKLFRKG